MNHTLPHSITITKEDCELALKEREVEHKRITCSCLIYQALKREGYPITEVGFTYAIKKGEQEQFNLENAHQVTLSDPYDWPFFIGYVFIVTELKPRTLLIQYEQT